MPLRFALYTLAAFASYMELDAAPPGGKAAAPMNVVLVHGFLDTGKIFTPLVRRLEQDGCHCFAPSLRPNDCSRGVDYLASVLSRRIDQHFGQRQPFVIIGFSMGGLITRDYVQNMARRERVRGAFLISTPNHGTLWGCLSPSAGLRQLAIGSRFLHRLNSNSTAWKTIPVVSYWTPYDLMIVPANSSLWKIGTTKQVACPLHPLMPKNRTVVSDIAMKLTQMRQKL